MSYPRGIKPNHALDAINVFAIELGAPALAVANYITTDRAQANAAYALAHTTMPDGLARNVTVTGTQAGGADDTPGIITVVGTNVAGEALSETIIPVNGSVVAGLKAFLTITSVTQSAWTAGGTADRVVVGFGKLVGFPASIRTQPGKPSAVGQIFGAWLGGVAATLIATFHATDLSKVTADASAGTYDGTKKLTVLVRR